MRILHRAYRRAATSLLRATGLDFLTGLKVDTSEPVTTLGSPYGGWAVPSKRLDPLSTVYCVGCGEDITFDLALITAIGCDVYAFDPTPRAIAHVRQVAANEPRYHFEPKGIWSTDTRLKFYAPKNSEHVSHSATNIQQTTDYFEAEAVSIETVMRENGHTRIDLLKLDVEGAEYTILNSILDGPTRPGIICVEFDEYYHPLDAAYLSRIRSLSARLRDAGYTLSAASKGSNRTFTTKSLTR